MPLQWLSWSVGLLLTGALPTRSAAQENCSVVFITPEGATGGESVEPSEILDRLASRCRPVDLERIDPLPEDTEERARGVRQARASLEKARREFLNVRLVAAERAAKHGVNLLGRGHALLDRYDELSSALLLLGRIQLELGKRAEAERTFSRAIAVEPTLRPDPALLPPEALGLFTRTQQRMSAEPGGSLALRTHPPGAELFIDGAAAGTTPMTRDGLLPGEHYVRLRHRSAAPWDGIVSVEAGGVVDREIRLHRRLRVRLGSVDQRERLGALREVARATDAEQVLLVSTAQPGRPLDEIEVQVLRAGSSPALTSQPLGELVSSGGDPPHTSATARDAAAPDAPIGTASIAANPEPSLLASWWFWSALAGGAVAVAAVTTAVVVIGAAGTDSLSVTVVKRP